MILFIDGHSAHINLAVAEFCRDNQIIIYCFPPHASHILQPLDVAVFGPLKKFWNSAVEEFTSKYRTPITKKNFLQVFDPAWQKCKSKKHGVSGFRATGLVPFNVENVDYRKVLQKAGNPIVEAGDPSDFMNFDQKLGVSMAFRAFQDVLSIEQQVCFERRMEEGYNVVDETDGNKLWRVFKILKKMQAGSQVKISNQESITSSSGEASSSISVHPDISIADSSFTVIQSSGEVPEATTSGQSNVTIVIQGDVTIQDVPFEVMPPSVTSASQRNATTPTALSLEQGVAPEISDELPDLNPIAGPSNTAKPSYVSHDCSPFKNL